ncbi:MAG: late competence development ComFB family protein [Treponema sp.]|jgi:competence protein ComFB|nr:late competence development ComFB family protein [Treponema sp.]
MAFIDNYDLENFKNEAEYLVFEELKRQFESYHDTICICNECVVDMAAIALNLVKPFYRHSILGTLYAAQIMEEDEEYAKSIQEAVKTAITKVSLNPAHDLQDTFVSNRSPE